MMSGWWFQFTLFRYCKVLLLSVALRRVHCLFYSCSVSQEPDVMGIAVQDLLMCQQDTVVLQSCCIDCRRLIVVTAGTQGVPGKLPLLCGPAQ